jgi:hypothetical protein
VPTRRARTAEEFTTALTAALAEPDPHLIDGGHPAADTTDGPHRLRRFIDTRGTGL